MTEKFDLSRRKVLGGLTTIGLAGAGAGLGTSALFSDEETFNSNTITAGTTNLAVTAGVVSLDTGNSGQTDGNGLQVNIKNSTADGNAVVGLEVLDMKPGDSFIIRTTVNVENNPMYVAASATSATDAENTPNPEPEPSGGTDTGGDALSGKGDLDNNIKVTFGYDSDRGTLHDNTLEGSLTADPNGSFSSATKFISTLQNGILYRGRNGSGGSPPGGHGGSSASATRIGGNAGDSNVDREKVTHFMKFSLPASVGNEVQGDSFSVDLVWSAEQVRNNADPSSASDVDGAPN